MIKNYKTAINNWPREDRPREKMMAKGEHALSNSELLAILLRSGRKGCSAIELARTILQRFRTFRNLSHLDLVQWKEFKGLGIAKVAQVKAAIEIGRRFIEEQAKENSHKITSSKNVAEIFLPRMRDLKKEVFKALLLNSKNKIIDVIEIVEGTVNNVKPSVREIFHKALQNFAVSIICVHNHPSGDPRPSQDDIGFTKELCRAANALQINLLDHIIIGNNKYYSFTDSGTMPV